MKDSFSKQGKLKTDLYYCLVLLSWILFDPICYVVKMTFSPS